MSRIGKQAVEIPAGVQASLQDGILTIKGALGQLQLAILNEVAVEIAEKSIEVKLVGDSKFARSMHGTTRANIQNMVVGVSKGFERKLVLVGVGYRAKAEGKKLKLELGFSHDVELEMLPDVTVQTPTQTEIILKSFDKQKIGQMAAVLRNNYRRPEPYKGKGIRYDGEHIAIKETKKK